MKRLTRILAYAGLVVALLASAVWVRSIWRLDQLQWDTDPRPLPVVVGQAPMVWAHGYDIRSSAGGLLIFWSSKWAPALNYRKPTGSSFSWVIEDQPEYPYIGSQRARVRFQFGGFELSTQEWSFPTGWNRTRLVVMPLWFVIAVLGAPGVIMLTRDRRRRRRNKTGCCMKCGYDLRATPGRCPECGLPAPAMRVDTA